MVTVQVKLQKLVRKFVTGGEVRRWWPVIGGVSAQVIGLEISLPNGITKTAIMRRHGEADLASNPNIAADEFRLLNLLYPYNLGTARPLFLDTSCEIFTTPLLLLEYIEGETIFKPTDELEFVTQLAERLSRVHAIPNAVTDFAFLPTQVASDLQAITNEPLQPDESMLESQIRTELRAGYPPAQPNPTTLLHGDYWPGNILWHQGHISGVIDWENATLGDPLSDLARARMELFWSLTEDAMQHFTAVYQALAPRLNYGSLPLYDLVSALRPIHKIGGWGLGEANEVRIRMRHRAFARSALARKKQI